MDDDEKKGTTTLEDAQVASRALIGCPVGIISSEGGSSRTC